MSIWTEPSPSDWDRWEALIHPENIDDRLDPGPAARQLGFRGSSAFKRADSVRHGEALEHWRELNADHADEMGSRWALDPKADTAMRIAWLKRHNQAWVGTSEVAVTHTGVVEIEDRSASLADVVRVLKAAGALDAELSSGTPRPNVPAALPLLPAPPDR